MRGSRRAIAFALACPWTLVSLHDATAATASRPCTVLVDAASDANRAFIGLGSQGSALPNDATLDVRTLKVAFAERRAVFTLAVTDVVNVEQRGVQGRLYEIDVNIGARRFVVDAYLAVDGTTAYSAFPRNDGPVQVAREVAGVRGALDDLANTITVQVPLDGLGWVKASTASTWTVTASRTLERGSSTSRTHVLADDATGDGEVRGDGRCRPASSRA